MPSRPTAGSVDDGSTPRAASRAARLTRLRMEAENVPDGPKRDAAGAVDDDASDLIVGAWYADDGRIFVDAAHIVELFNGDAQKAEAVLAILKDYLKQRPA